MNERVWHPNMVRAWLFVSVVLWSCWLATGNRELLGPCFGITLGGGYAALTPPPLPERNDPDA